MIAELLTYPFRRFGWWLRDPSVACRYRLCPEPQVGLSVWCREHTDRILAAELPQAANPDHQDLVQLNLNSSGGCSDGHPRVFRVEPENCSLCGGRDPYGYPFCPVCDYCCGC